MAKRKTPAVNRTVPKRADAESVQPHRKSSYVLSLTLENVRCFGPTQTLNLSDDQGRPARWTIILGVNGTGKTTILQLLAGFQQSNKRIISKFNVIISTKELDFSRANGKLYSNWSIIYSEFTSSILSLITKSEIYKTFVKYSNERI